MNTKQLLILTLLTKRSGLRYSELFRHFDYEDKFPYHLKHLIVNNYIEKRNNVYYITPKGISYHTKFDSRTLKEIEPKSLRYLFIVNNNETYGLHVCFESDINRPRYLILPGGTPELGDSISEGCKKLLENKLCIDGTCVYRSTHHYRNFTSSNDLLYDNLCLIFDVSVTSPSDKFLTWFTKDEILKLTERHPLIDTYILEGNREPFVESSFVYDYGLVQE